MEERKVDEKVKWNSQAAGKAKIKQGKIVRKITLEEAMKKGAYKIAIKEFPNHIHKFYGLLTPRKAKVAYFVEVESSEGKRPKLYMPFPSQLESVESKPVKIKRNKR